MVRKTAEKKQSAKKASRTVKTKKEPVKRKKTAAARKPAKTKNVKPAATVKDNQKTTKKAIMELLAKGKKQGYLTYDEINELLPADMLSSEQIDETFMMFDDNEIQVIDEKKKKNVVKLKKTAEKKSEAS